MPQNQGKSLHHLVESFQGVVGLAEKNRMLFARSGIPFMTVKGFPERGLENMVPRRGVHGPCVGTVPGGTPDHMAHPAEQLPFVFSARLDFPLLGKKRVAAQQIAEGNGFHEFPDRNAAQIEPGADGRQPLDGNGRAFRPASLHPGQGVRIFGTVDMDHVRAEHVPDFPETGFQFLPVPPHVRRGGNQVIGHGLPVQAAQGAPRIKHDGGQL